MVIHRKKFALNREDTAHFAAYAILREDADEIVKRLEFLHPDERMYYDKLKFDKRRISYLLGRISAKKAIGALSSYEDLPHIAIMPGIFQFPIVRHSVTRNLQVCITHCDNIGISLAYPEEHPVGIDLERTDEVNTEIIKEQLTPAELAMAAALPLLPSAAYSMIWTMKEALSKILKTGLTMNLQLLEIQSLTKEGDIYTSHFKHLIQYKAVSCLSGPYVCSFVCPRKTEADLGHFWEDFKEVCKA
jgi:4'-phosphopantetheinyl transferase